MTVSELTSLAYQLACHSKRLREPKQESVNIETNLDHAVANKLTFLRSLLDACTQTTTG